MQPVRRRAVHRDDGPADGAAAVQHHRRVQPPEQHQSRGGDDDDDGLLHGGVGHLQGRAHPGVAVPGAQGHRAGAGAAADGPVAVLQRVLRLAGRRRQVAVVAVPRRRWRGVQLLLPPGAAAQRHVPGARGQRLVPQHGGAPGRVRPRVPEQPGREGVPGHRAAAGVREDAAAGRGEPVPRHHRRGAPRQRVRAHGTRLPPGLRRQRAVLRLLQLRQDAVGHLRRPLRLQLRRRVRPVQARRRQRQAAVPVPERRRRVQRQLHLRHAGDGIVSIIGPLTN